MITQILGAFVAIAGILGLFANADRQPIHTLTGVVALVGGLILWALGRVECAVQPPTADDKKRLALVSIILLVLIVLVGVAVIGIRLFSSSG
jgi:drug/metabolite transporter (DMT)-like permease